MVYDDKAVQAFYRAAKYVNNVLGPQGIRPVLVEYQTRPYQLRFSVKGESGLFGIQSINQLLEVLGIGNEQNPGIPPELEEYIAGLARTEVPIESITSLEYLQTELASQLAG